jgi:hypothetical protein
MAIHVLNQTLLIDTNNTIYYFYRGKKRCLPTLDSEVPNLSAVNIQPIHAAAVAATLQTQWDVLKKEDEAARLVFRAAGPASSTTRRSGMPPCTTATRGPID